MFGLQAILVLCCSCALVLHVGHGLSKLHGVSFLLLSLYFDPARAREVGQIHHIIYGPLKPTRLQSWIPSWAVFGVLAAFRI